MCSVRSALLRDFLRSCCAGAGGCSRDPTPVLFGRAICASSAGGPARGDAVQAGIGSRRSEQHPARDRDQGRGKKRRESTLRRCSPCGPFCSYPRGNSNNGIARRGSFQAVMARDLGGSYCRHINKTAIPTLTSYHKWRERSKPSPLEMPACRDSQGVPMLAASFAKDTNSLRPQHYQFAQQYILGYHRFICYDTSSSITLYSFSHGLP